MPARFIVTVFAAILLAAFPLQTADAHTLAKDGRISAFMHIDPNDKPEPGKVNLIHFYFNDQDFRFSMEGCDCSVKVSEGKKVLYGGVLQASDRRVGQIKVFLPVNNFSYDVVVKGTPKSAGFFQPFTLKFDIDVGNPPPPPPPRKHGVYWLAAPLVLLGAGYWLFRKRHSRTIMEQ